VRSEGFVSAKLALLDALRERELAIRPAGQSAKESSALHEHPATYRTGGKKTSQM